MAKYGRLTRSKALEGDISREKTPIRKHLCFYTVWAKSGLFSTDKKYLFELYTLQLLASVRNAQELWWFYTKPICLHCPQLYLIASTLNNPAASLYENGVIIGFSKMLGFIENACFFMETM